MVNINDFCGEEIGEELAAVINGLPTLQTLSPLRMPWGQVLGDFGLTCSLCQSNKEQSETRADITVQSQYSVSATFFTLCSDCCSVSISEWRYSDSQILIKTASGWQVFGGVQKKRSIFRRLLIKLGAI
jgi:hypothetical protein